MKKLQIMRFSAISFIATFTLGLVAPLSAQDTVEQVETLETARVDSATRLRKVILSEEVIFASVQQFAFAPLIEMLIIYPEIETLAEDQEVAQDMINSSAEIWQSELRANFDEFAATLEANLENRYEPDELEHLANIAEANREQIEPLFAALISASVTYTNQRLVNDQETVEALANLRAQGGQDLIKEYSRTTRSLVSWIEKTKDQAYGPMTGAIFANALKRLPDLSSPAQFQTDLAARPDLRAIFKAITANDEERSIIINASVDVSLDSISRNKIYVDIFKRHEGLRPHLRKKMRPVFSNTVNNNIDMLEIGMVRFFSSRIDGKRSADVLDFVQSDLGKKLVGTVTTDDARNVTMALLEAQTGSADLEEAASDTSTALEKWASSAEETMQLSDEESTRFDAIIESQVGDDLYNIMTFIKDRFGFQGSLAALRNTPRNSLILQQELELYIRENAE